MMARLVSVCVCVAALAVSMSGGTDAGAASIDRSFGDAGTVRLETGSTNGRWNQELAGQPYALTVDGQGRILVGGGNNDSLLVVRLLPDGSWDPSFGDGGRVDIGTEDMGGKPGYNPLLVWRRVKTIDVYPDGRILILWSNLGSESLIGPFSYSLRLFEDGSLDEGYATGKGIQIAHDGAPRTPVDASILGDGSVLIGGGGDYSPDTGANNWDVGFVSKSDRSGTWIERFGLRSNSETVFRGTTTFQSSNLDWSSTVSSIFPLRSGKILISGTHNSRFLLARALADGRMDPSFRRSARRAFCRKAKRSRKGRRDCLRRNVGKAYTDFPNAAGRHCAYNQGAARSARGDIVQVGMRCKYNLKKGGSDPLLMTKRRADGSLVRSFGRNGRVTLQVKPLVTARSVAIQKNGKILVALWKGYYGSSEFGLFRFLPNGKLDKSFFGDGRYVEKIGDAVSTADKVVIDDQGRAVVAGGAAGFAPESDNKEIGGGSFVIKRFLLRDR